MDEQQLSQLSKRQQRELKKVQRHQELEQRQAALTTKKNTKKLLVYLVLILVAGGIGYGIYMLSGNNVQPYTPGAVHWHADVVVEICGQQRDLPRVGIGEHFKGLPLLHTHDDNTIHVEGQVFKKEDIALGKFMTGVGVLFSNTTIMEKSNGQVCEHTGKPGTMQMFVNGNQNEQFREYVLRDGDVIKIIFG